MSRVVPERSGPTFIDLEFDTATKGVALLGDIASSLVSLDELLRDLASISAYPSSAEFRKVEIVAIEMRSPLKIRLALFAISEDALKAFQEICRSIILSRDGRSRASAATVLEHWTPQPPISEQETQRLHRHVVTLQNATIPLKRVEVIEA
jgi:hypothetical protein